MKKTLLAAAVVLLLTSCGGGNTGAELETIANDANTDNLTALKAITKITSRVYPGFDDPSTTVDIQSTDDGGYTASIVLSQDFNGTYNTTIDNFCSGIEENLAKVCWRSLLYGNKKGLNLVNVTYLMPLPEEGDQIIYSVSLSNTALASVSGYNTANPFETDGEVDVLMGEAAQVAERIKGAWQTENQSCYELVLEE